MAESHSDSNYDPPVLNARQRVETVIKRDLLLTVGRVATGAIMGGFLAMGVAGSVATFLACAISGAMGMLSTSHICNIRRKQLAGFYNKEIAGQLGISDPNSVDESHLKAATEGVDGKPGNPEIKNTEEHYKKRRNFYVGVYAVTAVAMAAVVSIIGATGLVGWPLLATGAAVFYNEAFHMVEKIGNIYFHDHQKPTLTAEIESMGKKIDAGEAVPATQVLGLLVKAHGDVSAEIVKTYGKEYDELNIAQKRQLVEQYESRLHAKAITSGLADSTLNAKELAYIAYGQRSGAKYSDKPAGAGAAVKSVGLPNMRPEFLNNILSESKESPTMGRALSN